MSETDESESVNVSKLRELALRGKEYRETIEVDYLGETLELYIKPIIGLDFLPIAAILEDKLGMDAEEAQERLESEKNAGDDNSIDPSNFDREFCGVMAEAAVLGIDTEQGDVAGEDEDGLRQIFGVSENDDENIGLIGGVTLEIAESVLDISSDADKAEKFRRDGGGE